MSAQVDARPSRVTAENTECSYARLAGSRENTADAAQVVPQVEQGTQQTGFRDVGVDIRSPDIPVKLRNGRAEVDLRDRDPTAAVNGREKRIAAAALVRLASLAHHCCEHRPALASHR